MQDSQPSNSEIVRIQQITSQNATEENSEERTVPKRPATSVCSTEEDENDVEDIKESELVTKNHLKNKY